MTINTADERVAALTFGRTVPMILPIPDASLDATNRATMLGCYAASPSTSIPSNGWILNERSPVFVLDPDYSPVFILDHRPTVFSLR